MAISAVSILRTIDRDLDRTQQAVSSGYRVATSSDNAAYWSIATTMRSDNKSLASVTDALGLGAAMVDTAATGMNAAIETMDKIKEKLVAARESAVDRSKINSEIVELKQQLVTIADSAGFNGENWLKHEKDERPWLKQPIELVASVSRNSAGFQVETLKYERQSANISDMQAINALIDDSTETHGEYGILTSDAHAYDFGYSNGYVMIKGSGVSSVPGGGLPVLPQVEIEVSNTTTNQEIDEMISVTDAMLMDMTATSALFGTASARISRQENFVAALSDTLDRGVGKLVDADMNEQSARLKALQTQRDLGHAALAIANTHYSSLAQLYSN